MDGTLIILGCGGSAGVPAIGNWWGDCDPLEPRNLRSRPSIALQTQSTLVIIDTGPDFRDQMNREKLGAPDGIVYTHAHSDHINGMDELRTLQRLNKRKFPVYSDAPTIQKLQKRLDYMFVNSEDGFYSAVCDANIVEPDAALTIGDIGLQLFTQSHGSIHTLGVRIGRIAYSTDMRALDDKAIETLSGIETWIVDAGSYHSRTNPVHANIEDVIELNRKVGAKSVLLTHLPPTMDYQTLIKELPENFAPAYDGLRLNF